jgi:branched-chain amino acid transport system permease protein
MFSLQEIKRCFLLSIWFVFLTFPIMVIKVNPFDRVVHWQWMNMAYVAIGSFFLSLLFRMLLRKNEQSSSDSFDAEGNKKTPLMSRILETPKYRNIMIASGLVVAVCFPLVFSTYQTNIMITALMYVVLGLGLNIVVGLAGLLDLGFVAFYAVGAYSYALLNLHYDLGFWAVLPIGGCLAALFGIILGFPVLRLRGDYLAIVTLGFGEIIRLILENWGEFSEGPSGISNIPRPGFFGIELSLNSAIVYLYYLMVIAIIITVFVVNRLQDSTTRQSLDCSSEKMRLRVRRWVLIRERLSLPPFLLGAFWAGMMGVVFAAKTTFINPASFTFP